VPRVVLVLVILALTIYCLIDCVQSEEQKVRNLPKIVWLLLILIAPILGPAAWLAVGRPQPERAGPGMQRPPVSRRPSAPDDDPTFLAGLDRTNEERRRLEAWERELEAREHGLNGAAASEDELPPRDTREQDGPGDEPATRA
jgi:hypothetical protein